MTETSKKRASGEDNGTQHAPEYPGKNETYEYFFDERDEDELEVHASSASPTEDAARYIADMVGALALMAREARLDLLNYLLDMAHVEAEMQARRSEAPDAGA